MACPRWRSKSTLRRGYRTSLGCRIKEVQILTEQWRRDYNQVRPPYRWATAHQLQRP